MPVSVTNPVSADAAKLSPFDSFSLSPPNLYVEPFVVSVLSLLELDNDEPNENPPVILLADANENPPAVNVGAEPNENDGLVEAVPNVADDVVTEVKPGDVSLDDVVVGAPNVNFDAVSIFDVVVLVVDGFGFGSSHDIHLALAILLVTSHVGHFHSSAFNANLFHTLLVAGTAAVVVVDGPVAIVDDVVSVDGVVDVVDALDGAAPNENVGNADLAAWLLSLVVFVFLLTDTIFLWSNVC